MTTIRDVATRARVSAIRTPRSARHATTPHHTSHALLRLIRAAQPVSRADLARRLGVHRSTITILVKPLLAASAISESESEAHEGRSGRPPIHLSLSDGGELFVGVNVGVRQTQIGAAAANGTALSTITIDTPRDAKTALVEIEAAVIHVAREARGRELVGIGVSVPGPVDPSRARLLHAPRLRWRDVDVAASMRRAAAEVVRAPVAVAVENDATAAAIYERRRRWGSIHDEDALEDFVLVRAGTGIGVGLIINGEVYRGTGQGEGIGGEFGHMTIVAGGKRCVCGNRGCWEQYASARAATALYASEQLGKAHAPFRFSDLVVLAREGDEAARRALEQTGEYLGIGIANIITGIGIPRLVVSGRIVLGFDLLKEPLFAAVRRTMAGHLAGWTIDAGEATGAGLGGALEVAVDDRLVAVAASV